MGRPGAPLAKPATPSERDRRPGRCCRRAARSRHEAAGVVGTDVAVVAGGGVAGTVALVAAADGSGLAVGGVAGAVGGAPGQQGPGEGRTAVVRKRSQLRVERRIRRADLVPVDAVGVAGAAADTGTGVLPDHVVPATR